jgi:tRNA-binding protein
VNAPDSTSDAAPLAWSEFERVEMRVGTVLEATPLENARKPAIRMRIDLGPELGTRSTSAQITQRYRPEDLVGRQVIAVVNFSPKQIGSFLSQCLVLGAVPGPGDVVLLAPDAQVPPGTRIA